MLNREGVRSPPVYAGVKAPRGSRWTAYAISHILHNEIYWGGIDGMVRAYHRSKHHEVTWIPAYAPGYITPEEAARVHARLTSNQKYAKRNRRREWHTLLHGGLARCAQCGWALVPYTYKTPRADGSLLTVYRCQQSLQFGSKVCRGVSLSAETLDAAVEETLARELNDGEFLTRFFAAWEADASLAMGTVRDIETTIKETRAQIDNQVRRLAMLAPGDVLAAPVEANVRMLQETLPGLEERREKAIAAIEKARGNEALREELSEWFHAWMFGFQLLSQARKREFLFSVGAKVLLYRAEERSPRARLIIALPTSALRLPPAPWSTLERDERGWTLDLNTDAAAEDIAAVRGMTIVAPDRAPMTLEEEITWYEQQLREQGYNAAAARLRATSFAGGRLQTC